MPSDRASFPSAPQAALLLLAGFVIQYLLGGTLYEFRHALGLTTAQLWALVMVLSNGILITAVLHFQGMGHRELAHPSKASLLSTIVLVVPPVLLLIPLVVLLDLSLVSAIEVLLPVSAWEQQVFATMGESTLPAFIATCFIAPVVEEMLFRGILLRSFLTRYPRGLAIGYSALYFGVAHLNIYQFALAFCLGTLLGWLYERFRSLVPCIALHAAVNGTVVWLEAPAGSAKGGLTPSAVPALGWLAALAAAALGAMALRHLLTVRAEKTASEA